MNRLWSILFLLVPVLGVLVFVWAINGLWPMEGIWLPENINEYGGMIDTLFMFILYLTGAIFVGTSLVLFWFLWKYDGAKTAEPVKFTHGSHTLEVVWSILPAATLAVHRDLPDERLGGRQDATAPSPTNAVGDDVPMAAAGRSDRAAVRVADSLCGPRRKDRRHRRSDPGERSAPAGERRDRAGDQERGRAAQFLPAATCASSRTSCRA